MTAKVGSIRRVLNGILFKLPGMITCAQFEDFIVAYLDGELTKEELRIFRRHLLVCRDCKRYLADYERAMKCVKDMSDEIKSDLADVPEDLVRAVLAARQK